jgi:hypothetical protein
MTALRLVTDEERAEPQDVGEVLSEALVALRRAASCYGAPSPVRRASETCARLLERHLERLERGMV